jgi:hypothetical protein
MTWHGMVQLCISSITAMHLQAFFFLFSCLSFPLYLSYPHTPLPPRLRLSLRKIHNLIT